jgi:RNA polymerase sigma factor (sigma-70 family)
MVGAHGCEGLRRELALGGSPAVELALLPDSDLVHRCRSGEERAWEALVERYSRYVYAIAVRVYRLPEADAEDVFQEAFARAYERLDDLRDPSAVKAWLAQLTRRLAVDRLRQTGREQPVDELPEEAAGSDEAMDRIDEALAIREAMATLPEHCSEILDRFFARDESYRTIGEALDIPPGTIASRISRCLAKLRAELDPDLGA